MFGNIINQVFCTDKTSVSVTLQMHFSFFLTELSTDNGIMKCVHLYVAYTVIYINLKAHLNYRFLEELFVFKYFKILGKFVKRHPPFSGTAFSIKVCVLNTEIGERKY